MSEAATAEAKKVGTATATPGLNAILYILSGAFLIVSFSESMLIPALPTIQQQFNTTATVVAWIPGIYLLVGAVVTPIFGKFGDTYGKKKFLIVVMGLYTIAVILDGSRGVSKFFSYFVPFKGLASPCSLLRLP